MRFNINERRCDINEEWVDDKRNELDDFAIGFFQTTTLSSPSAYFTWQRGF